MSFSRLASSHLGSCPVSTMPSETVFAVTPSRPNSRAIDFISTDHAGARGAYDRESGFADPR